MKEKQAFLSKSELTELKSQAAEVCADLNIVSIMNAVPDLAFILNQKGEAVFVNKATISWLKQQRDNTDYLGLRPGELVRCFIAGSNVCGKHEVCQTCGSRQAVIQSSGGIEDRQDFLIYHENGDALYYYLSATPLKGFNQNYSIVVLKDKVHEKRRFELEKIFFQNLLKTAGNLSGYAQLLKVTPVENKTEYADLICNASNQLMSDIKSIKDLSAAEKGMLYLEYENVSVAEMIDEVVRYFQNSGFSDFIYQVKIQEQIEIETDKRLIVRILHHMLYNAIEASREGEKIIISCFRENTQICFSVNNPTKIPEEYQSQIFKRIFSTKSPDRGLGTYNMKLLGEKYLKGSVYFSSSEREGTTFVLCVPLERQG